MFLKRQAEAKDNGVQTHALTTVTMPKATPQTEHYDAPCFFARMRQRMPAQGMAPTAHDMTPIAQGMKTLRMTIPCTAHARTSHDTRFIPTPYLAPSKEPLYRF